MNEPNAARTVTMTEVPIIRESDKQLKAQLDQIEQVFRTVEEVVVKWRTDPSGGDSQPRQLPSELVTQFTDARALFFFFTTRGW